MVYSQWSKAASGGWSSFTNKGLLNMLGTVPELSLLLLNRLKASCRNVALGCGV